MKSNSIKNEFKKIRMPKMEATANEVTNVDDFIQKIRYQDREDERYILKQLLPTSIGLLLFTLVIMGAPIRNIVLFTGCALIYAGMIGWIIMYLVEYKNISKEKFNLNLFEFIQQKEKRLNSWKTQPVRNHILFAFYIIGVMLMILGNRSQFQRLNSTQIVIFIGAILIVLSLSGIIGEYLYRKRHKNKHLPLLRIISELKEELLEKTTSH